MAWSIISSRPARGPLSVASCSNSAESFPWTSMTLRALSSSAARRSFSRRSRATSRSRGSAGWRPAGLASASSAPRSRCLRHSEINEVYRPSRRSSAPLAALSRRSYSSKDPRLVLRRVPARATWPARGPRGPDRWCRPWRQSGRARSKNGWIVVVIRGTPPRPLSSMRARSLAANDLLRVCEVEGGSDRTATSALPTQVQNPVPATPSPCPGTRSPPIAGHARLIEGGVSLRFPPPDAPPIPLACSGLLGRTRPRSPRPVWARSGGVGGCRPVGRARHRRHGVAAWR